MLTAIQSRILRLLQDAQDRGEGLNQKQLAPMIATKSMNTISHALAVLREAGFIERSGSRRYPRTTVIRRIESITAGEPLSRDPLVAFLHAHQVANDGATPTYREIMRGMGLKTVNRIAAMLDDLHRLGAIIPHGEGRHATLIEVVKCAD